MIVNADTQTAASPGRQLSLKGPFHPFRRSDWEGQMMHIRL